MKTKMMLILGAASLLAFMVVGLPKSGPAADEPVPAVIQAVESGQLEVLVADATQDSGRGFDVNAIYDELRSLAKDYHQAREEDAKARVVNRMHDLMGQLFDAKVQKERHRVEVGEKRLNDEKRKLAQMQDHKTDLVKSGVQTVLDGQLPEWATPDK